jgi:hypothetical protein
MVHREASEFFLPSINFLVASLLSIPALCFEIMGFFSLFFLTKMAIRSPDMILLGKYPLSFLPDTIGTPGSKNDVISSVDHRDSLSASSYFERFNSFLSPILFFRSGAVVPGFFLLWILAIISVTVQRPRAMQWSRTAMKKSLV